MRDGQLLDKQEIDKMYVASSSLLFVKILTDTGDVAATFPAWLSKADTTSFVLRRQRMS